MQKNGREPTGSRSKAIAKALILAAFIVGVCNLMKMGKSLAVGEVFLYSEGIEEPVAHVVGTYSIPR